MTSSQREISSIYKFEIFTLFAAYQEWDSDECLDVYQKARKQAISQVLQSALSDQHDLLFLIRSARLASQPQNNIPTKLKNALYDKLTQYITAFTETTNIISFL